MDYRQNKHVLIGLGEYLALRGAEITEKVLRRLKNTTLGTARVIILLRCVTPQINNLATLLTITSTQSALTRLRSSLSVVSRHYDCRIMPSSAYVLPTHLVVRSPCRGR